MSNRYARFADPESSEMTVRSIATNKLGQDNLAAVIRAAFVPGEWFTDDMIIEAYVAATGMKRRAVRNNLARVRLNLERQSPPVIVRVSDDSLFVALGRQRLHFRLATENDVARPSGDRLASTDVSKRVARCCYVEVDGVEKVRLDGVDYVSADRLLDALSGDLAVGCLPSERTMPAQIPGQTALPC